jgi:threonine/homoserine/homoserine lactone efflux protein
MANCGHSAIIMIYTTLHLMMPAMNIHLQKIAESITCWAGLILFAWLCEILKMRRDLSRRPPFPAAD